ncbi:MAG: hypothetical protein IJW13_06180 [Clostridia bacterium]|nr:hypothetical protein [Clostridia bacterium]
MKKIVTLLIVAVLCLTCLFAGCNDSTGYSNGLTTDGEVSSNGGFAVVKGDYVYFVNGVATHTDDNTYGKVETGALVRVKTEDLGKADSQAQMVIPSLFVAGDKTSGFYIYGNEVYYATPATTKNKEGEIENTKLAFTKTSLDGKTSTVIATVESNTTVYRYVESNGVVYLVMETVNDEDEAVIKIYNATENKEVITTDHFEQVIYTDGGNGCEIYYTKHAYNENLEEDEDYNEVYRVTVEGKNELILSGVGKMADGDNGYGVSGVEFTLIKDTATHLYLKAVYVDTSVITITRYYAVEKANLKANEIAANKAALVLINEGTNSAEAVFAATSLYVAPNCIVYLDKTYGLIKYDYTNTDQANSENRIRLFYDEDLIGYTAQFWNNGYLYVIDGSNYYYRVNVANLVNLETGALIENATTEVQRVNYLANSTSWYLPEVVGDYFLSVYTASPYQSLVYASDMVANAALTDEEVANLQDATIEESVLANLDTAISLIPTATQETIDKYLEDTFGEEKAE